MHNIRIHLYSLVFTVKFNVDCHNKFVILSVKTGQNGSENIYYVYCICSGSYIYPIARRKESSFIITVSTPT